MRLNRTWLSGSLLVSALFLTGCNLLETKAPDSQAITSEIQAKLFADPILKQKDIRVSTDQGVVTLTGGVSTELEKAAVERIASQSAGVKHVVNQLTVDTASAAVGSMPESEPAPAAAAATAAKSTGKPSKPVSAAAPSEPEMVPAPATLSAPQAADTPATKPEAPKPVLVTMPAGTQIMVRMIDGIDSAVHKPGQEFAASVSQPVVVDDHILIRKGADARVRLINSKTAGKIKGRSELEVELVGLAIGDQTFAVESSGIEKTGASRGKRTAQTVGGGAALGGLIGAIAGKGKGAAIGAAIGAGAGTAVQVLTKGEQVKIPSETQLEFSLLAPIEVSL